MNCQDMGYFVFSAVQPEIALKFLALPFAELFKFVKIFAWANKVLFFDCSMTCASAEDR